MENRNHENQGFSSVRGKPRKGAMHTLEATIAAIMMLSFIITVTPVLKNEQTMANRDTMYSSLMDALSNDTVRNYVLENNLSGVKAAISLPLATNYTVGVSRTVAYFDDYAISKSLSSGTTLLNVTLDANFTVPSALLYIDGSSVSVGIDTGNDNTTDYSGVISSKTLVDLNKTAVEQALASSSTLTINITTNGTAAVSNLEINEESLYETVPDGTVGVADVLVAGNETYFRPTVVSIYYW